jgi:hypothetical protein
VGSSRTSCRWHHPMHLRCNTSCAIMAPYGTHRGDGSSVRSRHPSDNVPSAWSMKVATGHRPTPRRTSTLVQPA